MKVSCTSHSLHLVIFAKCVNHIYNYIGICWMLNKCRKTSYIVVSFSVVFILNWFRFCHLVVENIIMLTQRCIGIYQITYIIMPMTTTRGNIGKAIAAASGDIV